MLHLGDITKISGYTAPIVDVVVGGSPCQDLSVAGKRAGLDGERSGLFMEQLRIIKEMRENDRRFRGSVNDIRPRYMVWENVPGAFSSNKSEDFRIVLEETAKVCDKDAVIPMPNNGKWTTSGCILGDGWSIAWRVLDAQFYGVPQRRRRIALIADFGGHSAPEILFVRKSVSRDSEQSQPQRKETTPDASRGIGADDRERNSAAAEFCPEQSAKTRGIGYEEETSPTLRSNVVPAVTYASGNFIDVEMEVAVRKYPVDTKRLCEVLRKAKDDVGETAYGIAEVLHLSQDKVAHWFRQDECFAIPDADVWFDLKKLLGITTDEFDESITTFEYKGGNYDMRNRIHISETAPTLACGCGNNLYMLPQHNVAYTIDQGGGKSACNVQEGKSPTLTCTHGGEPAVCYSIENHPADSRVDIDESGKVQTLTSRMGTGGGNVPMVMESQVYEWHNQDSRITGPIDVGCTISTNAGGREGHLVITPVNNQCYSKSKRAQSDTDYETWKESDVANTLNAFDVGDKRTTECVVALDRASFNQGKNAVNGALQSNMAHSLNGNNVIRTKYIVRRLTPLECERLQGYPDGWTDIGEWTDSKGKIHKTSDAARYKALGNSIALPPWKWVLKRLCACYERDATLASLFDGIGGFPLIWEQINGKGTCLWASEIDEFPMAVTKKRIGE